MAFTWPQALVITDTIFDDIAGINDDTNEEFCRQINLHYAYLFSPAGYAPIFIPSRLNDSWIAFKRDRKHLVQSLSEDSSEPDHFKQSGILAYWLRRYAPVSDVRPTYVPNRNEKLAELIKKYPSELPAFDIGLTICNFFANSNKETEEQPGHPAVAANDFDYYKAICYLMKFKSLSPHSMGMIYRSLYTPLLKTD